MGVFSLILPMIILVIVVSILVLFYQTLYRALTRVSPENRKMRPAAVLLNLIPVFGLFWMFVTVIRISDSLKMEFIKRDMTLPDIRPAFVTGMVYSSADVLFSVFEQFRRIDNGLSLKIIGFILGLVCFVMLIMYWIRIADYSGKLAPSTMGVV